MEGLERPLDGLRVVVTRSPEQAAGIVAALAGLGAEPLVCPLIRIVAPADPEPLRRAVLRAADFDWIVFTSVNGVRRFFEERDAAGASSLEGVRFACVGPSTGAVLAEHGVVAEVVPDTYVAEAIMDELAIAHARIESAEDPGRPLSGARVLLPLAAAARPVSADGLERLGAVVERVEAYRTVADVEGGEALRHLIEAGGVDVVTFMSPSAVESFVRAAGTELGRAVVAAIGPITAGAAARRGMPVAIVAEVHTVGGLVEALVRRFGREPG